MFEVGWGGTRKESRSGHNLPTFIFIFGAVKYVSLGLYLSPVEEFKATSIHPMTKAIPSQRTILTVGVGGNTQGRLGDKMKLPESLSPHDNKEGLRRSPTGGRKETSNEAEAE